MTPDTSGDPLRRAHHKILNEDHSRVNHVVDVFLRCQCIMNIVLADIDRRVFLENSKVRYILDIL